MNLFGESLNHGHSSQTHFTNPPASFCYRCPTCHRVAFWGSSAAGGARPLLGDLSHSGSQPHYNQQQRFDEAGNKSEIEGKIREGGKLTGIEFFLEGCAEIPSFAQPRGVPNEKRRNRASSQPVVAVREASSETSDGTETGGRPRAF